MKNAWLYLRPSGLTSERMVFVNGRQATRWHDVEPLFPIKKQQQRTAWMKKRKEDVRMFLCIEKDRTEMTSNITLSTFNPIKTLCTP